MDPALLLVTRDPLLPGRVAGQLPRPRAASVIVLDDVRAERRAWSSAAHVLVDAELAGPVRRAGLPRRPRVAVLLPAGAGPVDWEDAVAIGIERMLEADEVGAWLAERPAREPVPPDAPMELPTDVPTDAPEPVRAAHDNSSRGRLVVVTGACGGVGTSTLAAALAVHASGPRVLVDLDALGGGLDLVLGLEEQPGPRWPEVLAAVPEVRALLDTLPSVADGRLAVLSHDGRTLDGSDPSGVTAVLDAARRHYDLVVVDLPRGGEADLIPFAARDDALVLLVVPPDVRGCAAALHRIRSLDDWPGLHLVLGPHPGPVLDEVTVGVGLELPLAGVLPYDVAVPAAAARGELPGCGRRNGYGRAVAAIVERLLPA